METGTTIAAARALWTPNVAKVFGSGLSTVLALRFFVASLATSHCFNSLKKNKDTVMPLSLHKLHDAVYKCVYIYIYILYIYIYKNNLKIMILKRGVGINHCYKK